MSTVMVAVGTLISATWILASNSWMHTPQGHEIIDGRVVPVDWLAVIFNPSFPYRLAHMVTAAFLATALVVGAGAAWHLLRGRDNAPVRKMLSMAMWMVLFTAPIQAVIGDLHGLNTLEHQPAKLAAIEGHWENRPGEGVPLILFGCARHGARRRRATRSQIPQPRQPHPHAHLGRPVPGLEGVPARGPAEFHHRLLDLPRHGRARHADDPARARGACCCAAASGCIDLAPFCASRC